MRTSTRSRLAAAVVAAVASLAAPAAASATTIIDIWKHLDFPAVKHQGQRGCNAREIVTGPGRYRWRILSAHSAHTNQPLIDQRVLRLRRARYKWVNCWQAHPHGWDRFSYLQNLSHGGLAWQYGDIIKGNFGNGLYHLYSTLDRVP